MGIMALMVVVVVDDEALTKMWTQLDSTKTEKLPAETPYAPWTSAKHETGAWMVKTGNKEVISKLSPETHPIVFDCINKAQTVGWNINKPIYDLHLWALRNKTDAFAEIWELHNPEAKATKLREAKAIGSIAKRFVGKTFYHMYYFDFRGRKYPATAYLHEQGSDLARGMLLRADKKAIGEHGFFWLLVSIASTWAGDSGREDGAKTDKIPLVDRKEWVLDNEEIILSYADAPKVNQGWMKADKPWQFLAACFELKKVRIHQYHLDDFDDYSFESSLECYIDGSNNGSQHLSALTRDEITAHHVNLVPQELPGDLYKYVAEHVWQHLEKIVSSMPKSQVKQCEGFIDSLIDFKKQISQSEPRSDRRKELVNDIKKFKEDNEEIAAMAAPVYWMRIRDQKHRRKITKRNVMTLPLI
jgi:DNA-directed RNA polymerase